MLKDIFFLAYIFPFQIFISWTTPTHIQIMLTKPEDSMPSEAPTDYKSLPRSKACFPFNIRIHKLVSFSSVVNGRKRVGFHCLLPPEIEVMVQKTQILIRAKLGWFERLRKERHVISFTTTSFLKSLSSISCCQLHTGWELISALLLLSKSYQFFWNLIIA